MTRSFSPVALDRTERRSSLLAAYWILFLDHFSFAIAFPLFPNLLLRPDLGFLPKITDPGAREVILFILLAALPAAQCFGAPLFGEVADYIGRRRAFLLTLSGTLVGNVLTTLSLYSGHFTLLLISRLITGFFSANLTVSLAAIADLSGDERGRAKKLSLAATCIGLAWIAAIGFGGMLPRIDGIPTSYPLFIFGATAALLLLSLWILMQFFHETSPNELKRTYQFFKGFHQILRTLESKKLRRLYTTLFFWFSGFSLAIIWVVPITWAKFKISASTLEWMFLAFATLWVLSSGWLNGPLVTRYSLWKGCLWGLIVSAICYFIAGASEHFLYFAALFCLSGVFMAITWGDTVSLISHQCSGQDQGKAMGLAQATLSASQLVGILLGGLIATASFEPLLYVSALMVLVAFCLLLALYWRKSRRNGAHGS